MTITEVTLIEGRGRKPFQSPGSALHPKEVIFFPLISRFQQLASQFITDSLSTSLPKLSAPWGSASSLLYCRCGMPLRSKRHWSAHTQPKSDPSHEYLIFHLSIASTLSSSLARRCGFGRTLIPSHPLDVAACTPSTPLTTPQFDRIRCIKKSR